MDDSTTSVVNSVLTDLSNALEDGVTLRLLSIESSMARVALEIDRRQCEECFTPRPVLEGILLKRLTEKGLDVRSVEVIEPPIQTHSSGESGGRGGDGE